MGIAEPLAKFRKAPPHSLRHSLPHSLPIVSTIVSPMVSLYCQRRGDFGKILKNFQNFAKVSGKEKKNGRRSTVNGRIKRRTWFSLSYSTVDRWPWRENFGFPGDFGKILKNSEISKILPKVRRLSAFETIGKPKGRLWVRLWGTCHFLSPPPPRFEIRSFCGMIFSKILPKVRRLQTGPLVIKGRNKGSTVNGQ